LVCFLVRFSSHKLTLKFSDNPKGYGDGEDARKYHPKLRGPVDPQELDIDPTTGMKNYIANEKGTWDTSKALVRRTLEKCIEIGRKARSSGRKEDEYEAFRLLGQSLHTLEDFPAHSNFCELALVSLGHEQVFTHVGDAVRIQAPGGKMVAPIVTGTTVQPANIWILLIYASGTFGSSDFIHSLLGGKCYFIHFHPLLPGNSPLITYHRGDRSHRKAPVRLFCLKHVLTRRL